MIFSEIKILTFDCYGTLIDWETGIQSILRPWAQERGLSASDEELLRAFSYEEVRCEREMPTVLYSDLLETVMAGIAERFNTRLDPGDAERLASSVGDWPPFPDTPRALRRLKERFRLAVISNVDRKSFVRTNEKLGVEFDLVVTAEDAGAYKPDHRPFLLAFERLGKMGIGRGEILHVAQSLFHDHVPAKELGLRTVWVNRRRGKLGWGATPPPPSPVKPDHEVATLAELVKWNSREDISW